MKQNHRSTREVAEQLGYNIRSVQRLCRQYLLNSDFCHTVNSAYQQGTIMATINQKNRTTKASINALDKKQLQSEDKRYS